MIGPENSEGKFEQEWRKAFEDLNQTPPDSVWKEIDRELAYKQLANYKTKNTFYQWAVAAVVLIASFLGVAQFIYYQNQLSGRVITSINVNAPVDQSNAFNVPEEIGNNDRNIKKTTQTTFFAVDETNKTNTTKDIAPPDFPPMDEIVLDKLSPSLIVASNYDDKEIYRLPTYDFKRNRKREEPGEKFWAGVDVSSGTFDPNYQSGNTTLIARSGPQMAFSSSSNDAIDRTSPQVREGMSSGETVSMGVNFGLKLSDRWTIESGVQYVRADATTQTNLVIESSKVQEVIPVSAQIRGIPQVESIIGSEQVIEYDYKDIDLDNQFQFASIPIKAGYLVLDKQFSIEINAGVAANLYLGNTLSDPSNNIDLTIGPGSSSPYREISLSGLAGVQFGYQLLNRFDLILEPNYRQSINSLTKNGSSFSANPSGFGIMSGIRFRFN